MFFVNEILRKFAFHHLIVEEYRDYLIINEVQQEQIKELSAIPLVPTGDYNVLRTN